MTDDWEREQKLRDLVEADQHIASAEALIARQQTVVEELQRDGHDTAMAEGLLETMRQSLRQMHVHRRLIEGDLARMGE
jgi:hypothetical protein